MEKFLTWVSVTLDLIWGILCNILTADDQMIHMGIGNICSDCSGPVPVIKYFEKSPLIYSSGKDSLHVILCEDRRFNKFPLSPRTF